ncbi:MAG TPA: PD-(D/E)XK nuclease family protein, partial [Microthrixaceae bacterium]|nr:PD-(D/E)XK nuclease family protein [Microthrixaceae bacterium]
TVSAPARKSFEDGVALMDKGAAEYDAAIEKFRAALAQQPDLWEAHLDIGVIELRRARLSRAAAAFEASIEIYPSPEALTALGSVYVRQGRPKRAVELFEQALAKDPDDLELRNQLAVALRHAGRLDDAAVELRDDPEYVELGLSAEEAVEFHDDAATLVRNYFRLEDPRAVRTIGLELSLEADVDGVRLRGIIDRLELDADGELVVTDYKTGAAPPEQFERRRLSGVHIYSLLCEQLLGRRPRRIQLLYLRSPLAVIAEPTDRTTRGTRRTLGAVWKAVERACERDDFRPQPSRLCDYCAFRAYCPAVGGDPSAAPAPPAAAGPVDAAVPLPTA